MNPVIEETSGLFESQRVERIQARGLAGGVEAEKDAHRGRKRDRPGHRIRRHDRRPLGDSPRESRIIRTVYKTGYSFAANAVERGGAIKRVSKLFLLWDDRRMDLYDVENILGRDEE